MKLKIYDLAKICDRLNKRTHKKPQETLDLEPTQSRESFSFGPSTHLDVDFNWMIGFTSLEVYISIFNITEEIDKFKLCTG